MKICIVTTRFPGRSTTFITQHAVGLAKRGHQVSVLSRGPEINISEQELTTIDNRDIQRLLSLSLPGKPLGNNLIYLRESLRNPRMFQHWLFAHRSWRPGELFHADGFRRILKQVQPDVTHVHFGNLSGQLAHLQPMSRTVTTWHGYDANRMPKERGERMYEELFRAKGLHTVGSQFMWKRLETLGARPENLRLIPMGIDLDHFSFRVRHRTSDEPLNILSVGRLHEVKGHNHLIDAIRLLVEKSVAVKLRILGDGQLRHSLSQQIQDLGLGEHVELLGPKSSRDVLHEMHRAHLFVLTSVRTGGGDEESQGVVYAEAQATGLPVIGSDIGGVPDSLIHGKTGFLCPEKDPAAIAETIARFVQDPQMLETFGRNGRAFVELRFGLDSMLDAFEQIYQEISG